MVTQCLPSCLSYDLGLLALRSLEAKQNLEVMGLTVLMKENERAT